MPQEWHNEHPDEENSTKMYGYVENKYDGPHVITWNFLTASSGGRYRVGVVR